MTADRDALREQDRRLLPGACMTARIILAAVSLVVVLAGCGSTTEDRAHYRWERAHAKPTPTCVHSHEEIFNGGFYLMQVDVCDRWSR